MLKSFPVATFAVLAMGFACVAKASEPTPYPVAMQTYNWTGFYVGINGGYGWGSQDPFNVISDRFDRSTIDVSGGVFGATVGAQIQAAHVVLGIEAEIDAANIDGSAVRSPTILGVIGPGTYGATTKLNSVSTAGIKFGYAMNNWLFYGTGGVAVLDTETKLSTLAGFACGTPGVPSCSRSGISFGGAAVVGVEYGFSPNWSIKGDLEHITAFSHAYPLVSGMIWKTAAISTTKAAGVAL